MNVLLGNGDGTFRARTSYAGGQNYDWVATGDLNGVAQREMKRIALGRKNWLTVGSPRGGQTAGVLFSFTSTCQRLGVEPRAYLQDVLTLADGAGRAARRPPP